MFIDLLASVYYISQTNAISSVVTKLQHSAYSVFAEKVGIM